MDYLVAVAFHCQVHDKLFNEVLIVCGWFVCVYLCVCLSVCFRPAPEVEKTRADKVDRWGHDLYIEDEQKPREEWEKEKVNSHSLSLSLPVS